jgi:hypothetical protein
MKRIMRECSLGGLPWAKCLEHLKIHFSHLNDLQFAEVRYECEEEFSVRKGRERQRHWEYTDERATTLRRTLDARNEEGFDHNAIDDLFGSAPPNTPFMQLGRGMRKGQGFKGLIGKSFNIKTKPKDKE